MSHHKEPLPGILSKEELDDGLKLHHLAHDTPSQLSDAFRAGAQWAAKLLSDYEIFREYKEDYDIK